MSKKYPAAGAWKKKPMADMDGLPHTGKPCVLCGQNTMGQFFVEYNCMRGDDGVSRLCHTDRKKMQEAADMAFFQAQTQQQTDQFVDSVLEKPGIKRPTLAEQKANVRRLMRAG